MSAFGTKRTSRDVRYLSAFGGTADNDGGRISRHRPDGQGHGGEPAGGRTPGACMGQVIQTIARHRCGELGRGLHLPYRSEVCFRGKEGGKRRRYS